MGKKLTKFERRIIETRLARNRFLIAQSPIPGWENVDHETAVKELQRNIARDAAIVEVAQ